MERSPQIQARIAGVFYLLTIVFGALALALGSGRMVANLLATASYAAVTILFYGMFKPVNKSVSFLAAFVGLLGCTMGVLSTLGVAPFQINSLVFFGFYCLLIGYLILKSRFIPRILGAFMMVGGLGWLTFASAPLAQSLSPYNMAPGILAEGLLTLWLLVFGVNAQRWKEQSSAALA